MTIKAIIFDADGMVITGERFSTRFSRQFGIPTEKINPFFENEFKLCLVGKADLKEVIKPYLSKWDWKGPIEDLLHFWFAESYKVDESLIEAVNKLKGRGIKCLLAINQEKYRTSYIKNKMGLEKVFDRIFSSSEIGAMKATQQFLDTVMAALPGVSKTEILFYDDRQNHVDFAKSYGFQAKLYIGQRNIF